MDSRRLSSIGALILVLGWGVAATAQGVTPACGVPPIVSAHSQPNIFSDEQEGWLGEAMADMFDRGAPPARDEAQSAYLQAIVDKLAKNLPPTEIKFRVQVIDSSELNGFSIAGGHIYILRKLAAVAQNDDELASVLGHEMGHIASHQFAFETTRDLKRLLNVTSVGDRADVYEKYQKLMDARYLDRHPDNSGGDSDSGQDEADRIGVYLIAAAGYRPGAFAEFWDRMTFTDGKTGGRFTDFLGVTKPSQKRLRGVLKLVNALPQGCGGTKSLASAEFEAWHKKVVENQTVLAATNIVSVAEIKLTPPLHMDLERLRFSPDGKTILAQDGGSVFAIGRDSFAVEFRFDAENALPAEFSPDSKRIVFGTPGLHSEEWGIADKKLLTAHEPITRHDCLQSRLSPDGRTIVCLSADLENWQMDLALLDSDTGAAVWEKKNFFTPTYAFALMLLSSRSMGVAAQEWMTIEFSADGNYLLTGPDIGKIGIDLRTRTPIKIVGDLKGKVTGAYAFVGSNEVVGVNSENVKDSGIFKFPEGQQLKKLTLPVASIDSVSDVEGNDYALVSGLKGGQTALVDLPTGKVILLSKGKAMDEWNGYVALEDKDGSVRMAKFKDGTFSDEKNLMLPLSPLGGALAVAVSPDGKHLALSTPERGGVWNVATGRQEFATLGFRDPVWENDGELYAEFPKFMAQERHVSLLTMTPRSINTMTYKVDDKVHLNYDQLIEWKQVKNEWEFTVHKPSDSSVLWTKVLATDSPRYTRSLNGGDLLFSSQLKLGSAKAEVKASELLTTEAAAVKDKENGRLIEIVDSETGKTTAEMVLELPPNYEGVDGLNRVADLLYMTASDNRTVVYSLTTGKQLRQIFGTVVAVDPETKRVCTRNRRDEAVVYDADGKELAHFRSGGVLRYVNFEAKGTRLMLLTADQTIRIVDVAKGDAGTAAGQ